MTSKLRFVVLSVWGVGCAARSIPIAPAPIALPVPAASVSPQLSVSSAPAAPASSLALAPLSSPVDRVLEIPVREIALGEGTRVAVLADPPYVGDARGLHPLPLPVALRGNPGLSERLGIFFGRDNEPRIMGQRQTEQGEAPIYWRHLPNGWRDGREEIGQLGGATRGALWGVLGGADPELVCRTGVVCIIKRTSGWTTVPAGDSQRIVTLQDGVLWGLDASGIAGIDKHGWALAVPAPTWSEPKAFWATQGEAWVSAKEQLFHFVGGQWQLVPSPVGEVNALWGARRDSIWIVGNAGAAQFDGQSFHTLPVAGPLRVVRGRSNGEVWFGGDAGLFRVAASQ